MIAYWIFFFSHHHELKTKQFLTKCEKNATMCFLGILFLYTLTYAVINRLCNKTFFSRIKKGEKAWVP